MGKGSAGVSVTVFDLTKQENMLFASTESELIKLESSCTEILPHTESVFCGKTLNLEIQNKLCQSFIYPSPYILLQISVTRFGEISPIWQNFTSLWQIFNSLFLIWQNDGPSLANLEHCLANFHCC